MLIQDRNHIHRVQRTLMCTICLITSSLFTFIWISHVLIFFMKDSRFCSFFFWTFFELNHMRMKSAQMMFLNDTLTSLNSERVQCWVLCTRIRTLKIIYVACMVDQSSALCAKFVHNICIQNICHVNMQSIIHINIHDCTIFDWRCVHIEYEF